jgi:hypothetical protein
VKTRERLNRGFFQGSLLLACFVGAVADSWLAFGVTLVIALGLNIVAREIRFDQRGN